MNTPIYNDIQIFGDQLPGGVYVITIALSSDQSISFGRFKHGRQFHLPAGSYLYVGSALGQTGASSLGWRLARHATRTGELPPHRVRTALIEALNAAGLEVRAPRQKKLHWHIDHLLDLPEAEIQGVIAIRTRGLLEAFIAQELARDAATSVIAAGLGASDHRNSTHLLYVETGQKWWDNLPALVWGMT
ncbi:MAG: GIY-YIG nuclease family protein [Anaerolineales bacterium]|jgi:Uri superfamily endonuclease